MWGNGKDNNLYCYKHHCGDKIARQLLKEMNEHNDKYEVGWLKYKLEKLINRIGKLNETDTKSL